MSVKFIQTGLLADVAAQLRLTDLRAIGAGPVPAGDYVYKLADPQGREIARFAWEPKQPGAEIVHNVIPFIAVALAGFALLAAFVLRYMRRTAAAIAAGEVAAAPSRHARSALRPAQPHLLRRAAGGGDRGGARRLLAGGGVLYRPRPFQGRQRHARPSDRRRIDPQRHAAAVARAARRRPGGAARRRRIRGDHLGRRRPGQDDGGRPAHHHRDLRALCDQRGRTS